MSTVTRWFTFPFQGNGDFILHVNVGRIADIGPIGVDRHSGVVASITELAQPTGEDLDFPFIGGARMAVHNIAPRDDGIVDMWVQVEWGGPLSLRIQFLVSND